MNIDVRDVFVSYEIFKADLGKKMYVTYLDAGQRDFMLSEVNGNFILVTSDFVALLVNLTIAAL